MNELDYYKQPQMSNSTLKLYKHGFKRGEFLYNQRKLDDKNGVVNYNFHIGNYFDLLITEPEKALVNIYDKYKNGKKFDIEVVRALQEGEYTMHTNTFKSMNRMKAELEYYEEFERSLFQNGNFQEEIYFDFFGLEYKTKLDYLEIIDGKYIIRDLKTIAALESAKKTYWNTIVKFDYAWQAHTYREAVSQKYEIPYSDTSFEWVFVEKAEPHEIQPWIASDEMCLKAKEEIENTIGIYLAKEEFNKTIIGMEF